MIEPDLLDEKGVDPYTDSFSEAEFREKFGSTVHRFTGVDYIEYYKSLGDNIEIVLSNDPAHILNYTKNVIGCDIHSRRRTKAAPEEQLKALKKRIRILSALLALCVVLLIVLSVVTFRYMSANRLLPGQNYSAVTTTTATEGS